MVPTIFPPDPIYWVSYNYLSSANHFPRPTSTPIYLPALHLVLDTGKFYTPITSFLAWSAIFLSCQLLTGLPGPYARSNFQQWAKLTSIFLILSFHLEQQAWLWACVESVVLIAFHFILPFLLGGIFLESLEKNCLDHRQHFGFFRDVNWIHG